MGARPGRVSLGRRPILLAPQLDGRTRTGLDVIGFSHRHVQGQCPQMGSPVRPILLLGGRNSASAGSSGPQTGLPCEDTLLRGDVTSTPAPETRYANCQIAPRRTRAPRSSILTRPRRRRLQFGPRHAFIGDWAGSRSGRAIRCRKPAFCRFKWSCWPLAPQVLPLVH